MEKLLKWGDKMKPDKDNLTTEGESRILEAIGEGSSTPSELASKLKISVSAVSQHLNRLHRRGLVGRERDGKSVIYSLRESVQEADLNVTNGAARQGMEDWGLIKDSYEALNKVWNHVLRLDLTPDELKKLREARNLLEEILHERVISR